jgi:uncharacterized RDD family membrane protein YckC
MRCPKCQYISFDQSDRCRNCGFDFSLAPEATAAIDLPIQTGAEAIGPMGDLELKDAESTPEAPSPPVAHGLQPVGAPDTGSFELPLFKRDPDDDRPLVTPAATPRAPLSVRRGAPLAAAQKPARSRRDVDDEPRLALDTAEMPVVPEPAAAHVDSHEVEVADDTVAIEHGAPAPVGARMAAAVIDTAILVAIDAAVLYFTLKACDLTLDTIAALPLPPFVAFLLLLDGAYFATFVAAGGQTIGKMLTGLRVVPGDPVATHTERVSLGHAIVRAAAYLVSALPAGAGFVIGIVGKDRRALHDRLADTRVVKA